LGAELSIVDSTLRASGAADARWQARAREVAALVPGVAAYDDSALEILDEDAAERRRLADLRAAVERHEVRFELGSAEIDAAQAEALQSVVAQIVDMIRVAESLFTVLRVQVEGYADPTGPRELNVRLSRERAEAVVAFLVDGGVPEALVRPVGKGTLGVAVDGEAEQPQALEGLRRVSFSVELPDDIKEEIHP
jgi:outer membrane protein OmpA-like peptidoglycan-associated protein